VTEGCLAWTYGSYFGNDDRKRCYMKNSDAYRYGIETVDRVGFQSGYQDCTAECPVIADPACTIPNVRFESNKLWGAGEPIVDTAAGCCQLCEETEGCKAWTWGNTFGNTDRRRCYMKDDDEYKQGRETEIDFDFVSGYPTCDLPCPATAEPPACGIAGTRFEGSKLWGVGEPIVDSIGDCCALCEATEGCKAWTYGNTFGNLERQRCYLKDDDTDFRYGISTEIDADFTSGYVGCQTECPVPRPAPACGIQQVRFEGSKLFGAGEPITDSASDCCALCEATEGCLAWTWGNTFGNEGRQRCYLKDDDHFKLGFKTTNDADFISGFPACDAECPPPAPEPACVIAGVVFDGYKLWGAGEPILDTAAECCAYCEATVGCKAWTYGNTFGNEDRKHCYLKDDDIFKLGIGTKDDVDFVSGYGDCEAACPATPEPACILPATRFNSNKLWGVGEPIVDTVAQCCALCEATEGCKAWTYGNTFGNEDRKHCYMKDDDVYKHGADIESDVDFVSGYPTCDSPCPPQADPPACQIVNVEFSGAKLWGAGEPIVSTAGDCCKLCDETEGCKAWTYGNYFGNDDRKKCFLKDDDYFKLGIGTDDRVGFVSGYSGCTAPCPVIEDPVCTYEGVVFESNKLWGVGEPIVDTAAGCCALCESTAGCKAWTWGNTFGNTDRRHCYMKDDDEYKQGLSLKSDVDFVSGFPTCDAPCPPAPPDPTCQYTGVVFENHKLWGVGEPITSTSAACCKLCEDTVGCKAWTWGNTFGNTERRYCYLKDDDSEYLLGISTKLDVDFISGYNGCQSECPVLPPANCKVVGVEFDGKKLWGVGEPKVATVDGCCALCSQTEGCVAWTYRVSKTTCFMKDENPFVDGISVVKNDDYISGYKDCVAPCPTGSTSSPTAAVPVRTRAPTISTAAPTARALATPVPTAATAIPTSIPTVSPSSPTMAPTTAEPTLEPSRSPTASTPAPTTANPTAVPSLAPTDSTPAPTVVTILPTVVPTVSPTPAPNTPVASVCLRDGVELAGNNLPGVDFPIVSSDGHCCDLCAKTAGCKHWSWHRYGNRRCYLKDSDEGEVEQYQFVSGNANCRMELTCEDDIYTPGDEDVAEVCEDFPDWLDEEGFACDAYTVACPDRLFSVLDGSDVAMFSNADGVDASEACCRCGGGTDPEVPDAGVPACVELDVSLVGNDLPGVASPLVDSSGDCCALCEATANCEFWTWHATGNRRCYLKSSDEGRTAAVGSKSGVKSCQTEGECPADEVLEPPVGGADPKCAQTDVELVGNNLPGLASPRVPSSAECCQVCVDTEGCLFWTWDGAGNQRCYLKDGDAGRAFGAGHVSGIPSCAATDDALVCDAEPVVTDPSCYHEGIEYQSFNIGNDDEETFTDSASECCALCTNTEACLYWSWSSNGNDQCYLKSSNLGARVVDNFVSGASEACLGTSCPDETVAIEPTCYQDNTEYQGDNVAGDIVVAESAGQCCDMCNANTDCDFWSWRSVGNNRCFLKTSGTSGLVFPAGVRYKQDFVSGFRDTCASRDICVDLPVVLDPTCLEEDIFYGSDADSTLGELDYTEAMDEGIEIEGNTIVAYENITSASSCCYLCSSDDDCFFWSWQVDGDQRCYLKDSNEGRVGRGGFMSGTSDCSARGCGLSPEPPVLPPIVDPDLCNDPAEVHVYDLDSTSGGFTGSGVDDVSVSTFTATFTGVSTNDFNATVQADLVRSMRQIAQGRVCEEPPSICEELGCGEDGTNEPSPAPEPVADATNSPTSSAFVPPGLSSGWPSDESTSDLGYATYTVPQADVFITSIKTKSSTLRARDLSDIELQRVLLEGDGVVIEYAVVSDAAEKSEVLGNLGIDDGSGDASTTSDAALSDAFNAAGFSVVAETEVLQEDVADPSEVAVAAESFSSTCDGAPDCTELNRFACSVTVSTCGPCLYGYSGQNGDSNNPCSEDGGDDSSGPNIGLAVGASIGAIAGVALIAGVARHQGLFTNNPEETRRNSEKRASHFACFNPMADKKKIPAESEHSLEMQSTKKGNNENYGV
jgi:hypothetical protein